MNDRTPIDPDLKNFFELTVLKQLFEDNFFAFVNGKPGTMTAVELAEQAFSIAHTQGYTDFDVAHRSQLTNALEEVILSYRDICNKYSVLANRFPDIKFSIIDGWRRYRIFNDGISGNVLKIVTEVRMAHGRTALEMFNEDIIKATVFLVDRYNYNYRMEELQEWTVQNNLIVWKDIIQGNGFLNFILTKARTVMVPMRVVVSTSTRPMVKPIPPPPTPCPWPEPQPGPVPPGPFSPPGPLPPGPLPPGPFPPSPCPPGPGPHPFPPVPPQPAPGPYPPPGPQPSPIYPPQPIPPPAPVPYWPPPPPPPPVIADCALVRQVIAERTVGGIKKGSVLPAGLTFTVFVEWLLHGDPEPVVDTDPEGVLELNTDVPIGAPYVAQLNFTITDLGTAQPHTVCFYERNMSMAGAPARRDDNSIQPGDRLIGTETYVEGQRNYSITLESLPDHAVVYYVAMDYKQQHSGEEKQYESNKEPWTPASRIYFDAVALDAVPQAEDIAQMDNVTVSNALLQGGIRVVVPTSGYSNTIFIAVPMDFINSIEWFAGDGTTHDNPPEPWVVPDVNGKAYAAYKWAAGYGSPQTFILKLKNQ